MSCCRFGTTCCIVSFVASVIIAFFALLGFFLKPPRHELEFKVNDASLAQFDFTAVNNTLSYSLSINITIKNPNKKGGIYFDTLKVAASYRGKIFALEALENSTTPFFLGQKRKKVVIVALQGRHSLLLEENDVKWYYSETSLGVYGVNVKLALRVRKLGFGERKSGYFEPPEIKCGRLRIPLNGRAYDNPSGLSTSGLNFKATKCTNVYILTSNKTTHIWQ